MNLLLLLNKKLLLSVTLLFFVVTLFSQQMPFRKGEKLSYNIYYQWGLIWKKAAEASLTTQSTRYNSDEALYLRMAARTTPFFDHFMNVRDTLSAITSTSLQPLYHQKLTHEGSYHGKEEIIYGYKNGKTTTRVKGYRDNTLRFDSTIQHITIPVFDMMTVFYYLRTIDTSAIQPNQVMPVTIVSGNRSYNIKIFFNGEQVIKTPDDKRYRSYKITLLFEYLKGKKIEKEEMMFWMSKDARRIPIHLSVKLPLGSLKVYYQGVEE